MYSCKYSLILLIIFVLPNVFLFAQTNTTNHLTKTQQWQLLDYKQDTVYGMSVNKAYNELLKGKKSHPVIVAVIDEGVDIMHEDLQGHIWTNTKEIPSNGIDDDKNGYIDDVHGWNFLGGKDGKMINKEYYEADREYVRLLPKYNSITDSSQTADKKEYEYFLKVKSTHVQDSINRTLPDLQQYYQIVKNLKFIEAQTNKQKIYFEDVNTFQPKDSMGDNAKKFLLNTLSKAPPEIKTIDLDSLLTSPQVKENVSTLEKDKILIASLKPDPNAARKEIAGDDPFDINDKYYGNNIVQPTYLDGDATHRCGLIAGVRNNGIGMNGIADNVQIMMIRAEPYGGDERDKDVALAIRYAVDNGAKVISLSFGKSISPQKNFVDDAIKYAAEKNVLLVHAAGSNAANSDSIPYYPVGWFSNSKDRATNFINVGAINKDTGYTMSTDFSNYGQQEVDVFAPGEDLYSTMPNNKYDYRQGSYNAPVAGVAALILEYYPQLTAAQVKNIIMQSVTSLKGKIVYKPGTQDKVDFATLCVSGGVVNAYNALQLAEKTTKH